MQDRDRRNQLRAVAWGFSRRFAADAGRRGAPELDTSGLSQRARQLPGGGRVVTWPEVRDYLGQALAPHLPTRDDEPPRLQQWLDALEGSADGQRLGLCMAIDMRADAISPEVFAHVIAAVDLTAGDVCGAFEAAIKQRVGEGTPLLCASRRADTTAAPGDGYIRILSLDAYATYYAGDLTRTVDPADLQDILDIDLRRERPLGYVKSWWTGKKGVVWVAPWESVRERLAGTVKDAAASELADRLGLAPAGPQPLVMHLVGVKYPPAFDKAAGTRPTVLDAWWGDPGGLYLSWPGTDGWGRTWSCSGQREPLAERVHDPFQGLSDDFVAFYVGLATIPSADYDRLMNEGYRRCEAVLAASGPERAGRHGSGTVGGDRADWAPAQEADLGPGTAHGP